MTAPSSRANRAWLAGAGSRPNEPGRQDRPEDVQARLGQHPQVGPRWTLTEAEASRFLAAVNARHDMFSPDWLLRPGGHCATKGGLTTLWAFDPAEEPDSLGRRPSDINAGTVLTPELAQDLCAAYNARQAEKPPT